MRRVIVEVEASINGAMGSENDFWTKVFEFHSEDVKEYLNDLLFTPDALLWVRRPISPSPMVWPTRQGKDADRINNMPKYVASRTLKEPLTWNSTLIKGDVAEEIRKLKQEPGKDLLQYGVGELTAHDASGGPGR